MQAQNPISATTIVLWGVLRCTHVQMNIRLLNITNFWCCVREYWINQIMHCIPRHFCLCKQVCKVKLSYNPPNLKNTCSLSLPNPLVIYGIMPLVQGWCGYNQIPDNWYVITKYLFRNSYPYSKISSLIPQVFNNICGNPRSKKLRYKTWSLKFVLGFTVPDDRCIINIYDDDRMQRPILHVWSQHTY